MDAVSQLRVSMFTWNVFTQDPPIKSLRKIVQTHVKDNPDIYIVGLQEVRSWPMEYTLQMFVMYDPWTRAISQEVCKQRYVLVSSERLQGLLILVFASMNRLPFLRNFDKTFSRTGLGGIWGNKGAVCIRFECFGRTFCFVVAHLNARTENEEQRHQDYHKIVETTYTLPDTPPILEHDYVFWLGDLNYKNPDSQKSEQITQKQIAVLKEEDRLVMSMKQKLSFVGFTEGKFDFAPTYKFLLGTDTYDIRSAPAWTDRILWKTEFPDNVKQLTYASHKDMLFSDHKPVWADFKVKISSGPIQQEVFFDQISHWEVNVHAKCSYNITHNTKISTRDWIGLYKVGFRTVYWDYCRYVWAEVGRKHCTISFDECNLPSDDGEYVLCYNSYLKECVLGVSNLFKISSEGKASTT